jgi:hypothetical protein
MIDALGDARNRAVGLLGVFGGSRLVAGGSIRLAERAARTPRGRQVDADGFRERGLGCVLVRGEPQGR